MSIVKLERRLTDRVSVGVGAPVRFVSSSTGPTGSTHLFTQRSNSLKTVQDARPVSVSTDGLSIADPPFDDGTRIIEFTEAANRQYRDAISAGTAADLSALSDKYLNLTNISTELRAFRSYNALRFESPFTFDVNLLAYQAAKRNLLPAYRRRSQDYDFSVKNYNTLNFFTSSDVPADSCLMFANDLKASPYAVTTGFTFDFWINPRYTVDSAGDDFTAGTLFHLSSSYAISLVTGSSTDAFGRPDGYRLMLQLSQSVDASPDSIDLGTANNARTYPNDLTFLSSDNVLKRNHWHHVAIRWGNTAVNDGTGSFVVDNVEKGVFNVPSASVNINAGINPLVLTVGARYEGANAAADNSQQSYFFNTANNIKNGVADLEGVNAVDFAAVSFTNPFAAEVHDLKIFGEYRLSEQVASSSMAGVKSLADEPNLLFYLPPFFVRESPTRRVLVTPYDVRSNRTTKLPIEVTQSMSLRSHYVSLENYLREFKQGLYPLPHALTGSAQARGTAINPMDKLYELPEVRKRNLTVLPCDNGLFKPQFGLLASGTLTEYTSSASPMHQFQNDFGVLDLARVSLRNVISKQDQSDVYGLGDVETTVESVLEDPDYLFGEARVFSEWPSDSLASSIPTSRGDAATEYPWVIGDNETLRSENESGFNAVIDQPKLPINGAANPYAKLSEPQRYHTSDADSSAASTGDLQGFYLYLTPADAHSKPLRDEDTGRPGIYHMYPGIFGEYDYVESSFFNIPKLFYGDAIERGTFVVRDTAMTGSGGKVAITLRESDGVLYRGDAATRHADWNKVGNLFSDDGIAWVMSPLLPRFGKDQFELEFSGSRNLHVFELNVPCPAGQMDSSSNPTFNALKPNDYASETANTFAYVTAVNLHDRNLNIIGKAVFSQPIRKRPNDGFFTRIKIDY